MTENKTLIKLEEIQKEISLYEKKGLDASALRIFIKNFKEFLKVTGQPSLFTEELTFEKKLEIIKTFLEDKKIFPTIKEVIDFANTRLKLDFKDQKESRETTIDRIIGKIKRQPELKDTLKSAVISIRNEYVHSIHQPKSKKEILNVETFIKWAEIIKKI